MFTDMESVGELGGAIGNGAVAKVVWFYIGGNGGKAIRANGMAHPGSELLALQLQPLLDLVKLEPTASFEQDSFATTAKGQQLLRAGKGFF